MHIKFVGDWDIVATIVEPPNVGAGSLKRFVVAGANSGNGAHNTFSAGVMVRVTAGPTQQWTLTVENQDLVNGGAWIESPVQAVQSAPSAARLGGIRAGSACGARGRSSHNPPVVGSSPTRPTSCFDTRGRRGDVRTVGPHLVT